MLSKGLGLFGEAERPSPGPQPLGREVLSLTHGSGLFLGQWDVGCVMLCEGQCYDTCWPPHWVSRRPQGPSVMSTACVLVSLSSRDNCHSQGDKDVVFITTGYPALSNSCPILPAGYRHALHFSTLLSPWHFLTFTEVSPPSLAVL